MSHRGAEFYMAHSFPTHNRTRNFDAALVADDALIPNAFIFSAVTLIVLFRAEYLLIKESVLFGALGAVVDGLRFGDLSRGPCEYAFRRR